MSVIKAGMVLPREFLDQVARGEHRGYELVADGSHLLVKHALPNAPAGYYEHVGSDVPGVERFRYVAPPPA